MYMKVSQQQVQFCALRFKPNNRLRMFLVYWTALGILFSAFQNGITQMKMEHVKSGCPSGSNRHGDFCYSISSDTATQEGASRFCKSNGGSLAVIKDYKTQIFLQSLRMRKYLHNYWFGLHDIHGEGNWIHDDNTKLSDYTNWGKDEPNSYDGDQDCASLRMYKDLTWDDEYCSSEFLYICEFPEAKCKTKSGMFGNICYVSSHDFASYNEAKSKCKIRGGQLALIKSKEIDIFIRNMVFNDEFWLTMTEKMIQEVYAGLVIKFTWYPGSWIGIKYKNSRWTDDYNTTVYFPRWSDNDPTSASEYCVTLGWTQGSKYCGHFYSQGKKDYKMEDLEKCYAYADKWNPVECSQTLSYICQYPAAEVEMESNKSPMPNGIPQRTDKTNQITRQHISMIDNNQAVKCEALEDLKNTMAGINIGVAEFIIIILSCILVGILLTVCIHYLRRNGTISNYHKLRNVFWRSGNDARIVEEDQA